MHVPRPPNTPHKDGRDPESYGSGLPESLSRSREVLCITPTEQIRRVFGFDFPIEGDLYAVTSDVDWDCKSKIK